MLKVLIPLFSFGSAAIIMGTVSASACGPNSDCQLGDRTYRIAMPEGHDGKSSVGAVIFNHGYRGTAAGLMRNKRLTKTISEMGLAFVAPKSAGHDWDIPNAPFKGPRVEMAFFDALKADIVSKHFVDAKKIMVTGFSAGGMMVWNLACNRGDQFAGFAPMSGTFWAPVPKSCPTMPSNIIHMHGAADRVVPMKGRAINETHQGDVNKALELATGTGSFGLWKELPEFDGLSCREKRNDENQIVHLCMHAGGHTFKSTWLTRAWREFKAIGAISD